MLNQQRSNRPASQASELNRSAVNEAFNSCKATDGWVSFLDFGKALIKRRIDYKQIDLTIPNFIRNNRLPYIWRHEEVEGKRFGFVKRREKDSAQTYGKLAVGNDKPVQAKNIDEPVLIQARAVRANIPRNALQNWGIINMRKACQNLSELALNERWYYKVSDENNPYPILDNYLRYTFFRLQKEGNKVCEEGEFACFNTGLVDKRYESIYALFKKKINEETKEPAWYFRAFCIKGENFAGKELTSNFKNLPEGPHYFSDVLHTIYDVQAGKPQLDTQHIIVENAERLPMEFLEEHWPKAFEKKETESMAPFERKNYFKNLGLAIENDDKLYRTIKYRIEAAVDLAVKRVQWNYKTAIPVYFPTDNKMSLLLPLSILDDEKVDVALVVDKQPSGNYQGQTIIPMDWAYKCARLVSRPDSDWLSAGEISSNQDIDEI